ncbi:hypothetical protein GIB67_019536 [Kingdonia uniflora]|uniref:TF-B3 domain-containing protein n=1 Tax=Kingdonia uniflora TaxID=39325 RepID=A0A7J7N0D6_9MAGN|nr:hypothetical protein GIB67_019536 [Kingdonia uniflora]
MANDFQKPSFFKIMLGDYKKKLRIPSHFASHISTETSKVAILEGPSGNCWEVKVQKIVNDIFFKKGWRMFLEDHTLQERDFLVFIHDGRMRFSVKIFGPNACEREDSFRVECSLEPTRSFPVSKNCQGCNFRQEQRAFTGVKAKDAANSFSSRLNFFVRGMKAYNVENRCQLVSFC